MPSSPVRSCHVVLATRRVPADGVSASCVDSAVRCAVQRRTGAAATAPVLEEGSFHSLLVLPFLFWWRCLLRRQQCMLCSSLPLCLCFLYGGSTSFGFTGLYDERTGPESACSLPSQLHNSGGVRLRRRDGGEWILRNGRVRRSDAGCGVYGAALYFKGSWVRMALGALTHRCSPPAV